jgi:hypothetical protein
VINQDVSVIGESSPGRTELPAEATTETVSSAPREGKSEGDVQRMLYEDSEIAQLSISDLTPALVGV